MRVHNLYTDAKGESHFRDIEVEWAEERRGSKLSKRLPATGIIFRETQAEHNLDWHPASRRQFVVTLSGESEIELEGGRKLRLGPGHILLAEDTTGQGHISRAVGSKDRLSLFITLPDAAIVPRAH